MAGPPRLKNDDPMYQLIRDGKAEEFNKAKTDGTEIVLTSCDFRSVSFKGIDVDGLDLSDCYFRQADLRGVDFRKTNLKGASINGAKVSGTYFPANLPASEISLSLEHGTRMRCSK